MIEPRARKRRQWLKDCLCELVCRRSYVAAFHSGCRPMPRGRGATRPSRGLGARDGERPFKRENAAIGRHSQYVGRPRRKVKLGEFLLQRPTPTLPPRLHDKHADSSRLWAMTSGLAPQRNSFQGVPHRGQLAPGRDALRPAAGTMLMAADRRRAGNLLSRHDDQDRRHALGAGRSSHDVGRQRTRHDKWLKPLIAPTRDKPDALPRLAISPRTPSQNGTPNKRRIEDWTVS
jgi:hypothetical protein